MMFLLVVSLASAGQESTPQAAAPSPTAAEIMARVAVNQDRSEALRKQYVYRQHIHVLTHKPGGRLQREETSDYDIIPQPDGVEKKLKLINGRYWKKGKYQMFEGEPVPETGSLDGGLIQGFRDDLTNDKSKDGLGKDLFPLTSEEQQKYDFELLGQEQQDGKSVYHIGFKPKDKGDIAWAGEAYIDAAEFQPVLSSRNCRAACHSWSGRCWEPTCRESASTWPTSGRTMESGFPFPSARSSGCGLSSSSTATSRSPSRTPTSSTPTSRAR
jgi:hypothetical protein